MSQNLNVKVAKKGIEIMSDFNQAYRNICDIRARFKALIDSKQALLDEVLEKRKDALAKGEALSKVEAEYPRLELDNAIRALEEERDKELEPWKKQSRENIKAIPESLYGGYVYAMDKGISATLGKNGQDISVGDKKTIHIDRTFSQDIQAIATEWGFGHADDDKAVKKFADIIKGRISGMRKDTKGGYLALKSKSQLSELFLLATIQYFLEGGKLVTAEDYTLTIA